MSGEISAKKRNWLLFGLILVAILFSVLSVFFYTRYQSALRAASAATKNQDEAKTIVERVGNIYAVPTDEDPTVAQVKDKQKLKDSFFSKAENGDYVLVYAKAKLALIFRPNNSKLINVGPITVKNQMQDATTPEQ